MSGNHTLASNVNKNVLINELGLRQISNTTVYKKNVFFILSPSMQSSKSMWFDLKQVNINRYNKSIEKGYLLFRFFDRFLLANLDDFLDKMIDFKKFSKTSNSGIHWKFKIRPYGGSCIICNLVNKSELMKLKLKI